MTPGYRSLATRLSLAVGLALASTSTVAAVGSSTVTAQPTPARQSAAATEPPASAQGSTATTAAPMFSQDELDALLAPVALYPDGLLTQVLMASTYPLDIVLADRFVKQNVNLHGAALDDAVADKTWDPSVQSLTAYPTVLAMMSDELEWTERLGNAVVQDQPRVMDTVQALRRSAKAAGNLESTSERSVVHEKETIVIEPAQKEVVYVPYYDASVVYGAYAAAYSYYYERYYGSRSVSVSYSKSYSISANHWGWARADWSNRRFAMSATGNRFWSGAGRAQAAVQGAWQHDPMRGRGVDSPSGAMQQRLGSEARVGSDVPRAMPANGDAMRAAPPLDRAAQGRLPMAGGAPPTMGPFGGGPPSMGSFGGFPGGGGPPPMPGPPPGPPGPH